MVRLIAAGVPVVPFLRGRILPAEVLLRAAGAPRAKRDLRLVSEFPVAARPTPLPRIVVRNRIESINGLS